MQNRKNPKNSLNKPEKLRLSKNYVLRTHQSLLPNAEQNIIFAKCFLNDGALIK